MKAWERIRKHCQKHECYECDYFVERVCLFSRAVDPPLYWSKKYYSNRLSSKEVEIKLKEFNEEIKENKTINNKQNISPVSNYDSYSARQAISCAITQNYKVLNKGDLGEIYMFIKGLYENKE